MERENEDVLRGLCERWSELCKKRDEQIKIINNRISQDAKAYERDQYLIRKLREQLERSAKEVEFYKKNFMRLRDEKSSGRGS